jgi:hypothetical protein
VSDDAESGKWLKVKARMPNNEKVIALSDAAFRLHISVSCWCADEMTDGAFKAHVPSGMPKAPRGKQLTEAIKKLVQAGLWIPTVDGYEINDFLKYNMSRARYEALRAAGKLGGERSGDARRSKSEAPAEAHASAPAQPKPKQTASKTEAPPEHDHDHEERSNKNPHPKDLTRSRASGASLEKEDFLNLSIGERAGLVAADPSLAEAMRPHTWPEVRKVFKAFTQATGRDRGVGPYDSDSGTQRVVDLLVVFELDRLLAAVPIAVGTSWWREEPERPLAHLTPTVVETALNQDAKASLHEAGVLDLMAAATERLRRSNGSSPPPPILLTGGPS